MSIQVADCVIIYYALSNIDTLGKGHSEMVEAIRRFDADCEQERMERHLQATMKFLLSVFIGEIHKENLRNSGLKEKNS